MTTTAAITLQPRYAFGVSLNVGSGGASVNLQSPSSEFLLSITPFFQGPSGAVALTFEAVSKNVKANPYTAQRDGQGNITALTYTTPAGNVVKTFNRTGGLITSIVLSGPGVPAGVSLTKTLSYTAGVWTGATYS